jgi:hypothetical protein
MGKKVITLIFKKLIVFHPKSNGKVKNYELEM